VLALRQHRERDQQHQRREQIDELASEVIHQNLPSKLSIKIFHPS
jgi:hypothetical protein